MPTNAPARLSLLIREVALSKPAAARTLEHSSTELQPGTGLVLPRTTAGSDGGNSELPRAWRIGAIASCQIRAPLPPPKPPTFCSFLGLNTMTLAVISGV